MKKITFFGEKKTSPTQQQEPTNKAVSDYSSLFLGRNELMTRHGIYVSKETFGIISKIVHIIGKDITACGYIDNVVRKHLEQYKNEINELFRKEKNDLI